MNEKQIAALREGFETQYGKRDGFNPKYLRRNGWGGYVNGRIEDAWQEWIACYQHLAPMVEDAERYLWLRNFDLRCKDGVNINPPCAHVHASLYSHAVGTIPAVRLVTGDELDRAIDSAREQEKKTC